MNQLWSCLKSPGRTGWKDVCKLSQWTYKTYTEMGAGVSTAEMEHASSGWLQQSIEYCYLSSRIETRPCKVGTLRPVLKHGLNANQDQLRRYAKKFRSMMHKEPVPTLYATTLAPYKQSINLSLFPFPFPFSPWYKYVCVRIELYHTSGPK